MNASTAKKMRKEVRKYRRFIMQEFLTAPFKMRVKIAWLIVKGKKRIKKLDQ